MFKNNSLMYKFLWLVTDMFLINILWIIFCIPIITIGASTAAAIEVNIRILKKEETYIFKNFWHGFKRNFKDGTKLWVILAVLIYMLMMNFQYIRAGQPVSTVNYVIIALSVILMLVCFIYAFPLITKYENTTRQTMMNSLMFAFKYPGKFVWSVVQLLLLLFSYIFFSMLVIYVESTPFAVQMICLILMLFGPEFFLMTWAYRGMVLMDQYQREVDEYNASKAEENNESTNVE